MAAPALAGTVSSAVRSAPALVRAALRSVEQATPEIRDRIAEYASKAMTSSVPGDAPTLSAVAKRGPAPAAVILKGAAMAGMNPEQLFDDMLDVQRDAALSRIYQDLRQTFANATVRLDSQAVINADSAGIADALYRKRVIMFAREKFGGPTQLREAHALMRAFLSMDTRQLENEIALHLAR